MSWEGITTNTKCTDQFLVKYWESTSPLDYHLSNPVNNDIFSTVIRVTPKVKYVFEVIAREDKGAIAGVDYNRAENVEFSTSTRNPPFAGEDYEDRILVNPSNGKINWCNFSIWFSNQWQQIIDKARQMLSF